MDCNEIENHLTDYLRGELPGPIREEVVRHLAGCADCRREIQSIESLWSELAQVHGAEPEMETMRVRFRAMLESSGFAPRSAVKSWKSSWPVLRIVLAMMFLTIAVFAAQQKGVLTAVISRLMPQQPTDPVAPVKNGVLAGRLLFPDGGPAANMRVALVPVAGSAAAFETQTDSDGRYRLENIPVGRYYVTAGQMDYLTYYPGSTRIPTAKIVAVTGGTAINDIDFSLSRAITVRVSGHVSRASNQVPSSTQMAALVGGNPEIRLLAPIATDGSFAFPEVRPGNYQISTNLYSGNQPQKISVSSNNVNVDLVIPLAVTVTGVATLAGGGLLPYLAVEFTNVGTGTSEYHSTIRTDADGKFTVSVPPGDYHLTTSGLPNGYSVQSMKSSTIDLLKSTLTIAASDSPQIAVTLGASSPPPWSRLRGRVIGLGNGITATGISLGAPPPTSLINRSVIQYSPQVPISNDGSFEFPMVLPGTYAVRFVPSVSTSLMAPATIVVPAGSNRVDDLEIRVPPTKQVAGRILWEGDGPHVRISFYFGDKSNQRVSPNADANGRFRMWVPEVEQSIALDAIPDGYILKSFTYGASDLLTTALNLSRMEPAELQVVLTPAKPDAWVRVSGRVTGIPSAGPYPTPSSERRVMLYRMLSNGSSPDPQDVAIGKDNTFVFPKVLPGNYLIRANVGQGVAQSTTVMVSNKDVTNIEIPFPKLVTVIGHAGMEGNGPIPSFGLTLTDSTGLNSIGIHPKPDGSFTLELPEGEFSVGLSPLLSLPAGVTASAMTYGNVDLRQKPLRVSADKPEELHITFKTAESAHTYRVSGHVLNFDPQMRPIFLTNTSQNLQATVGANGNFEFQGVFPGRYRLNTSLLKPSAPSLSTSLSVVVGTTDLTDVEIAFPKRINVVAHTVVEGEAPSPQFSIQLTGPTATTDMFIGVNTEIVRALLPIGELRVKTRNLPPGYSIKSLSYGPTDLLKEPITISENNTAEILITLVVDPAALHKISGRVTGNSNALLGIGIVGPVSVSVKIAEDGSFESSPVPAGNYVVGLSGRVSVPVVVGNKDITGLEIANPAPPR